MFFVLNGMPSLYVLVACGMGYGHEAKLSLRWRKWLLALVDAKNGTTFMTSLE